MTTRRVKKKAEQAQEKLWNWNAAELLKTRKDKKENLQHPSESLIHVVVDAQSVGSGETAMMMKGSSLCDVDIS